MAVSSVNHFFYSLKSEQYDLIEQTLNSAYALAYLLHDATTFQEIDWGNAPRQSAQVRVVGMQLEALDKAQRALNDAQKITATESEVV